MTDYSEAGETTDARYDTRGALRSSLATADALLEAASEGIVIVGADGRIQLVNASAERMFGYGRDDLYGQNLEILLPEPARGLHAGHRAQYFAQPRVRPMGLGLDLTARRQDGTVFPVEISLSFVDTGSGRLGMAFITDISERKRTEAELARHREALHQAEKLAALGTFAAGLAHEINNPIGVIGSRIELMLDERAEGGLPPAVREDLEVLQRNVQRIARIAHGLLSFARQSPRERQPTDLNRVVEETLLLFERQMARAEITVGTVLAPALPPLLGDETALQQVLTNLLANAREAMSGPGRIAIATRRAPDRPGWVELVVADSGPGIPANVLPRIFDPFFTTKAQGTGLGLSVSYGIVRDHGGTVDVDSAPGRGTTFVLAFPGVSDDPAKPGPSR